MREFLAGRQPLWRAFWVLFGGGYVLLFVINGTLLTYFQDSPSLDGIKLILAPLFIVFLVFSLYAVWRCSKNVAWAGWTWIARGFMIYFLIMSIRSTYVLVQQLH
jgi:hypothetical protein